MCPLLRSLATLRCFPSNVSSLPRRQTPTLDLVVGGEEADVRQRDPPGVPIIKLHGYQVLVLVPVRVSWQHESRAGHKTRTRKRHTKASHKTVIQFVVMFQVPAKVSKAHPVKKKKLRIPVRRILCF